MIWENRQRHPLRGYYDVCIVLIGRPLPGAWIEIVRSGYSASIRRGAEGQAKSVLDRQPDTDPARDLRHPLEPRWCVRLSTLWSARQLS